MTLDLNDKETTALLLLLKLGLDCHLGDDKDDSSLLEAIEGLRHVPNMTIDRLIAKVSLAAGHAVKGDA